MQQAVSTPGEDVSSDTVLQETWMGAQLELA